MLSESVYMLVQNNAVESTGKFHDSIVWIKQTCPFMRKQGALCYDSNVFSRRNAVSPVSALLGVALAQTLETFEKQKPLFKETNSASWSHKTTYD